MLSYLNSDSGREKLWSFNTITMPRGIHQHSDPDFRLRLSVSFIRKNWDRLLKRLKRVYGDFSYIRVIEMHKSRVLHIHLMLSFHHADLHTGYHANGKKYSYSPSFKKILTDCGFGYITDNQNVVDDSGSHANAGLVTGYITKYMSKQKEDFADAVKDYRLRRVVVSRDIGSPKDAPAIDEWWLWNFLTLGNILDAEKSGSYWIDLDTGEKIERGNFKDNDFYPPPDE